jgi:F-type H+-transporting ATPase subunit delta
MSLRTSANRYAKALFDVALQEKVDLAQVEKDLTAMNELFVSNNELAQVTTRAGVPDAARVAIISEVATKSGVVAPVKKLLVLLAEKRKLDRLPDLLIDFRERLLAHQNIVQAEVTSAAALSPEKTKALEESLSKVTGKKVELSVSVDPTLLGGVVARIGSTVYDGSVRTQLAQMRQELVKQ